ncbi:MAG TPA: hypothetical protein VNA25_24905 [Phycisphaerae bacterium]|nr:hypothetical protein [Phycisphaerae bacterium]
MKAIRTVLVVGACMAVAMAAGCDKKYTIKISNVTSEMQRVELLEKGVFAEASLVVSPDGGRETVVIKQAEDDTTAYTLKANTYTKQFTLSKSSINPMYFHITPNGIIGPVSKDTKVKEAWDIKKAGKVDEFEVIE